MAQHSLHHVEQHLEKSPVQYMQWRFGTGDGTDRLVSVLRFGFVHVISPVRDNPQQQEWWCEKPKGTGLEPPRLELFRKRMVGLYVLFVGEWSRFENWSRGVWYLDVTYGTWPEYEAARRTRLVRQKAHTPFLFLAKNNEFHLFYR